MEKKKCENCNKKFTPNSAKQKFCSNACKTAFGRKLKKELEEHPPTPGIKKNKAVANVALASPEVLHKEIPALIEGTRQHPGGPAVLPEGQKVVPLNFKFDSDKIRKEIEKEFAPMRKLVDYLMSIEMTPDEMIEFHKEATKPITGKPSQNKTNPTNAVPARAQFNRWKMIEPEEGTNAFMLRHGFRYWKDAPKGTKK